LAIYSLNLTLAANGVETALTTTAKTIVPGVLERFNVLFPAGHNGLTFFALFYNGRQIYPHIPGQFLQGSDIFIPFTPNLDVLEAPHLIELRGYNISDDLQHTIYTFLEINPKRESIDLLRFMV